MSKEGLERCIAAQFIPEDEAKELRKKFDKGEEAIIGSSVFIDPEAKSKAEPEPEKKKEKSK